MSNLFKTELHCHTGAVSVCGKCSADYLISRYIEAGYSTVVVTDHFCRLSFSTSPKYIKYLEDNNMDATWNSNIEFFVSGYKQLKEAAKGRLNILLGLEFMSWADASRNDYLLYGVTEEWLKASPFIPRLTYREMSVYARECGLKFYQAHPFRINATISDPAYLDGIEVYNATVNVNSNNDIADVWADHYGLKKISGSDFHESIHHTAGGILTTEPIVTNEQLLKVLEKDNGYELIKEA